LFALLLKSYCNDIVPIFGRSEDWIQAIKSLNNAISICPRSSEGIHLAGLSDSLLLLSESYGSLGKWEDAVHSARLAVVCAHKRPDTVGSRDLGSLLDGSISLLATYYTLAVMLERSGVSTEILALEWYTRVVRTANKMLLRQERAQADVDSISRSEQQGLEHMHLSKIAYNQMIHFSYLSEEAKTRLQRLPPPQNGFVEESMVPLPRNSSPAMQLPEMGLKVRCQSALPRLLSDPAMTKLRTLYPSLSTNFARDYNDRDSVEDCDNVNFSGKEDQGNLLIGTNVQESKHGQMSKDVGKNFGYDNKLETWHPHSNQHQFSAPTMSLPPPSQLYYNADLPQPQFQLHQRRKEQQDSSNEVDYHNVNKKYENINNYRSPNNEDFDKFVLPDRDHDKPKDRGKAAIDRNFYRGHTSPQRLTTLSRNKSDMTYIATACSTNRKMGRRDTYNMFAPSLKIARSAMLQQGKEPKQEEKEEIRRLQEGRKGRKNRLRLELKSLRLEAALLIQRAGRDYVSRIIGRALKKQRDFELRRRLWKKAALVIQRIIRGHQSRERVRTYILNHYPQKQELKRQELLSELLSETMIAANPESSRVEKDGRKFEALLPILVKEIEEERTSRGHGHVMRTRNGMESTEQSRITVKDAVSISKDLSESKIEPFPIDGNTNAASLRLRNKKDMQQHMRHVYSQISIQKAERSRKMALMRSEKAVVLQTLVRGHLERRRHRGLLRHFERSMDLNRREISLRNKERTVKEYFEGLALSAQEDEERSVCPNTTSDLQREASVVVNLNGIESKNATPRHSQLNSCLDSLPHHDERSSLVIESEQDQSLCLSESGNHDLVNFNLQPVSPDVNHNDGDELEGKDCEQSSSPQPLLAMTVNGKDIDITTNFSADSCIGNDVIIDERTCLGDDFNYESVTVKDAIIVPITEDTDPSMDEVHENTSKEVIEIVAEEPINDGKKPKITSENSIIGALFRKFSFASGAVKEI